MSLRECIIDESSINQTIHTLKSNKRSETPEVNGETISNIIKIKDEIIKRIKYDLNSRYTSGMIERVEIQKGGGKFKLLKISNICDRLVQLCFKQILEPIVEKSSHNNFFGFRLGRSAGHVVATCYHCVNLAKLHFVVDIILR